MTLLPSVILLAALHAGPAPTPATTPSSAAAASSAARLPWRCEPPTFGRDKLTVDCTVDAAAAPQRIHIKVHFTGSHDDTTASMEVAIGDTPTACSAGSKTNSEAEEGEVTLDCAFTAAGAPGATTLVRASVKWFHAQYVDLEVNGRRP